MRRAWSQRRRREMRQFVSAIVSIALASAVAVLAVGCGDSGSGATDDQKASTDTKHVRIALVMEQPLEDGGWNSGWKRAGDELKRQVPGTEVTFVPNTAAGADSQRAFRTLATQGYDLVVGISAQGYTDLLKVVGDF